MKASPARVRIGSFELDLRSGELRSLASDGAPNRSVLREQPFQVLRMLVEREGQIVTRSEIKKRLWPNDTIVDHDHIINIAIGVLRRTLGDSADSPRYIETLARRGYRLVLPVEWLDSNAPAAAEVAVTSETSPLADLTGKKVCQYRVLEVLGGGGMGMVYKAEDLKLGRRAALKFLPEELAADPIALQRLEREARTASALNHPNICTIYDIEDYQGQPFIAMELLEGETLQQHLAASAPTTIPVLSVVDIALQVCLGLEAAHHKDIVHRDIKPANIFLKKQGQVKLLDFGVAKLVANQGVADGDVVANAGENLLPSLQPSLTLTGVTVGTIAYMSPEQIRKEELDARSDLFSLGIVLYEMATGHQPFTGETAVAVQEAILAKAPPSVETLKPEIPGSLARVIRKALRKDRAERYQTALAMRHDLEGVRGTLQSDRRRGSRWIPAAAAVLAIAGALAWWSARRSPGVTLTADDTIVIAHLTNATGDRAFDEALNTALRIAFEQTPYLNVLAADKVRETLSGVGVDRGARITPEVALRVCRRTGSRIVVAPAIADAGNRLGLELRAIDCRSGSTISQIRNEAASRDGVVAALGSAALQLRREIGEPESSLASYNAPLQDATSSSPDALELLTLGYRRQLAGSSREAIPFYQRAVQVDPNFALAQAALSTASANIHETASAAAAGLTAFEQRGRLTAPARFNVESTYYREVTGDWEQSCEVLSRWVQAFPHDVIARNNFALCLSVLGQQDRALGEAREAARLWPAAHMYAAWVYRSVLADRLGDAQTTMDEAIRRAFDSTNLRDLRVLLAFLRKDDVAMQQQWAWGIGRADGQQLLAGKALVEAYRGQFGAAHRSVDTATALGGTAPDAIDGGALHVALMRIEVGFPLARSPAVDPKQTLPSRLLGTLLLARAGRRLEAMEAADGLRRDHPSNTIVQQYGLPLIDAAVRLRSSNAAGAVAVLEPVRKYDLADTLVFPALYPSYLRGLAYLQTADNAAAATEFQKILAHPGLVRRHAIGALARLQLARAQRAMGQGSAARNSYEAFLALWMNADSDVPVYREAKAEYNALLR